LFLQLLEGLYSRLKKVLYPVKKKTERKPHCPQAFYSRRDREREREGGIRREGENKGQAGGVHCIAYTSSSVERHHSQLPEV
jgi:hypothetical protein